MTYRHAIARTSHEDLASGAVLHSAPGFPAFPVRLASEIFQRALALRGGDRPAVLWDPCCGGGYLLTVVALLHRRRIASVLASDLDPGARSLAERNLALLTRAGLAARAADLRARAARFGKPAYDSAAQAAHRLAAGLDAAGGDLPHAVCQADALDPVQLRRALGHRAPDIVITDVPYGEQTHWHGPGAAAGVAGMLDALTAVLPRDSVIAVTVRGRKVPAGGGPRPRASFKIGTRAVALFRT
ncbi:rRNA methyltransferase [Sphaerisporangium sp. TRM90804]|uniref:rRNA methyltransferase n=1 Tax=Sphaerisporangium sp. TRM90804 TaxID=3031113 RepID=UPI00244BBD68|nr:rRNA methyltransferase [Sphaerisporangium sp. TRM90804]MDH2430883.1 rRNA methyltransferase [Sphaerisporangium sp. TRM90804]